MANLPRILLSLAGLAFILAVISVFVGPLLPGTTPEGFSRACTNLALLGIGAAVVGRPDLPA